MCGTVKTVHRHLFDCRRLKRQLAIRCDIKYIIHPQCFVVLCFLISRTCSRLNFTLVYFRGFFSNKHPERVKRVICQGRTLRGRIYPLQKRLFTLSLLIGNKSLSSENSNFHIPFRFLPQRKFVIRAFSPL